jgi:esterase
MQLNYKKIGEKGPAVIILHGLLGALDNWQTIARQLSAQFQVYCIDQRNHGKSPHDATMSYEVLAQDIIDFYRQHQITKATLIGHSMGGKVAMLLALQHPELIEKLVIIDIAPVAYEGGHEDILFAMAEAPLHATNDRKAIDIFLEKRIPQFAVRQFVLKNLARNEQGALSWKCNLDVLIQQYRTLMVFPEMDASFSGKSYFIKGQHSAYIQEEHLSAIYHYFPNAVLITIPEAGHWVHAENPADFLLQLHAILQQ